MALRDHFRDPESFGERWDSFHGGWPMKMTESLKNCLPANYSAGPVVHLGCGVEIDVGAYRYDLERIKRRKKAPTCLAGC